jgi:2'-5' RNA ligase
MLLDIVILPPTKVRQKIGNLSKKLGKNVKPDFVVDNQRLIPHLSLYHIKSTKLKDISKTLTLIATKTKRFSITIIGLRLIETKEKIWDSLNIKNSQKLQALHKKVVLRNSIFRQGSIFKQKPSYSKQQIENIEKYGGSPNIFASYHPHITLGRFNMALKKKLIAIKFKKTIFQADYIYLTAINKNYQVIKILKKFKLQ